MEEDHCFRSSSSALLALSSLTPPSPVLSPRHLPTTLTSGDIPILLDLVDQVTSSSLYEDDHRASGLSFEACVRPSNSDCTVGTFGPTSICRNSWIPDPWFSTPGNRDTLGGVRGSLSGLALDSHTLSRGPEAGCSITDDHSQITAPAYLLSSSIRTLGVVEALLAPVSGEDRKGENTACQVEDEGSSSDSSVLVQNIEETSGCSSSYYDLRYLLSLSNTLPHRSRLIVGSSSSCLSSPRSESLKEVSFESLPEYLRSPKGSRTSHSSKTPATSHELRPFQPSLPPSLAWLDKSSVELLIDQEGFRAVQARFRFTGYSNRSSWDAHGNNPDNVAQFRPISRQIFNFHYAALEALPVLRRMTVSGDETRDYIMRQASLGLRVNGVYTVRGNEALSLPATFSNGDTHGKLRWKFEYFVEDRKVDATGKKIVDGEKTLTPLTFSCSPLLLHPFQGKRITMIHVVKKSVATKLMAEKMEPPLSLSTQTSSPAPKCRRQPMPSHSLAKSSVWNIHRRAKSYVPLQLEEHDGQRKSGIGCRNQPNRASQDMNVQRMLDPHARSIRHRRASSAGEMDRPCIGVTLPKSSDVRCHESPPAYHPARNIIPPSHLVDLLDQETDSESIPLAIASPPPPMNVSSFQPLKPSPRHHHVRVLRA